MSYLEQLIKDFGLSQLRVVDIMDDKLTVDRKTLTAYPLSESDIEIAEAGIIHNNDVCEVCNIINKEA